MVFYRVYFQVGDGKKKGLPLISRAKPSFLSGRGLETPHISFEYLLGNLLKILCLAGFIYLEYSIFQRYNKDLT